MDIVCLGEVLIDVFPNEIGRRLTEVTTFQPKPGGAPANAAVAAARLGASAAFIGKVGDDIFVHYLEEVLKAEGVDTRGLRYDPDARTTLVFIAKTDENTAEYVFYRNPGADILLRPDELDTGLLRETQCLHFGSLSLIQWEYYFYIDIAGHPDEPHVATALKELRSVCAFYKLLGTYPLDSH